jgi:hypothetical protein
LGHISASSNVEIELGGAELRIASSGHCSHLRVPKMAGQKLEKSKRGTVKGLSRGAAARCKRLLLSVDQSKVQATWEGCNTVPLGEFTFEDFRRFLRNWRRRVEREWVGVAFAWVKELTAAGTPHLHYVVVWPVGVCVPSLKRFRAWNDAAWAEVVQSSHPSHKKTGCSVHLVRSWERVVRYLSGYLTEGSEGRDRQSDTGRMWGVIGRKFLPSSWKSVVVNRAEKQVISRALCRYRRRQGVWLLGAPAGSLSSLSGPPVGKWRRLSADPLFKARCGSFSRGFSADAVRAVYGGAGWSLRAIKPRPYRREYTDRLWDQDVESSRVERSPIASPVWVNRRNKLTGEPERVQVDEVNDLPSAWHYLPSVEVERLLAFVRRDPLAGLTKCERRWAVGVSISLRSGCGD